MARDEDRRRDERSGDNWQHGRDYGWDYRDELRAYGRPRPERRGGSGREDYGRSQRGGEEYGRDDYRGGTAEGPYDRRSDYGGYGRGSYDADWRGGPYRPGYAAERRMPGYGPGYDPGGRGRRDPDDVALGFGDERRWEGPHRGRGPKGYTRSDERIHEDLCDRLAYDSIVDASDIEVTVGNGEVTLNGTVENRMTRRQAENIAEDVAGVRHVQNNLRVRD